MIDDGGGDGGDGDGDDDGTVDAGSSVKEGLYPPPSSLTTLDATNEENDDDDGGDGGDGGDGESDGDGGSSTNSSTRADGREQSLLLLQSSNCWCVLSSALVAHVGAAPPTLAER